MTEENREELVLEEVELEETTQDISYNIHNAVYDIVNELREYTEERYLPLMDNLNYIDLFYYMEDNIIKKT